ERGLGYIPQGFKRRVAKPTQKPIQQWRYEEPDLLPRPQGVDYAAAAQTLSILPILIGLAKSPAHGCAASHDIDARHSSMQRVQTRRHTVERVIGLQVALIGLYREAIIDDCSVAVEEQGIVAHAALIVKANAGEP